ncbi:DEAD/DEAH box helicase [Hydrogenoanaerobacterium saccharovorans]|uniref:DEAD/DEAH box helicase n=1 Tax=Hydrogenoanaerobacterium saccharovorans TaxID=474960 RepID=A0ABS2GKT8_9FIRM|nr:DEAD/DEAH box helicase [Hydrogenoanaerobacterium saccharovorans]MBM6922169.1 DEAD/DEAH box helicase [Hydrogenoanaerobacterium saccharovorans]MBS5634064.1 DEAD/DEAH box helicase [Clostridiales bacterium]
MSITFRDFPLSEAIQRAVAEVGYTEPTPIQAQSIPLILEGKDVIGRSHTGTGKTAAFGLPAIEMIDPDLEGVQVLALCPTRELAMQAAAEVEKFARYKKGVKVVAVYGGASMEKQIFQLKKGANFVIGTPGRIMDHLRRRTLRLGSLRMVILDEADEMLNMGFREDIETILAQAPEERQTVLFSATMPQPILDITREYQKDPVMVAIGSERSRTAENIEQFYFDCPMGRKMDVLNLLLAKYDPKLSVVFCNTKKMVDELSEYLTNAGYQAVGIHGDMRQSARTQVMASFKSHRTRILIATDVAARGIDVENVDAVFNFDIPQDIEFYVHRIGRTARAGKEGKAYTLISGRRQFYQLRDIMASTGAKIVQAEIPSASEIYESRLSQFAASLAESLAQPLPEGEAMLHRLTGMGLTAEQVAEAALERLLAGQRKALPEVQVVSRRGESRDGKQTGVVLSIGRRQRIAPNFILGAIADATGIPGKQVGKIDIYDDYTVVQLGAEDARLTAETMATCRINGHKTEVRLLTKADLAGKNAGGRREERRPDKRGGKPYGRVDGNGRRTDTFQKNGKKKSGWENREGRSHGDHREGKPSSRRGKKDFRKGQDSRRER